MRVSPADIRQRLGRRHHAVAVATYSAGSAELEVSGTDPASDFEIGSLSKGLTGLLYHHALERGEAEPTTTLGELLPLGSSAAAAVTLGSVAIHASGLPRLPVTPPPRTTLTRTWRMMRRGENPYGDTLDELLAHTAETRLGSQRFAYSNLGFCLLGHAVAAAARTPYAALVRNRIATPLGMTGTYAPTTNADLAPLALSGASRRGRPHEPWTGEAIAPAGGIRCTGADLGALLVALVEGSAPGIGALDPVASAGKGARIGAGWITVRNPGQTVTWHNGRTGGFASWLGVDRDNGVGVAIVTATAASVDGLGFESLRRLGDPNAS